MCAGKTRTVSTYKDNDWKFQENFTQRVFREWTHYSGGIVDTTVMNEIGRQLLSTWEKELNGI